MGGIVREEFLGQGISSRVVKAAVVRQPDWEKAASAEEYFFQTEQVQRPGAGLKATGMDTKSWSWNWRMWGWGGLNRQGVTARAGFSLRQRKAPSGFALAPAS